MATLTARGPESASSAETWDLVHGFTEWRLWAFMGLQDIRQRYRRSTLGPLWLVLGLGVTVFGVGLLYSQILHNPSRDYVPFLAVSLLVWTMISSCIVESTSLYVGAQGVITSMQVPYTSFTLRLLTRNLIVAAHGVIVVILAFLWYQYPISLTLLVAVPGLLLLLANLYWICLGIGLLCARYRDFAQMVIYTTNLVFFLSPIIWAPGSVRAGNPFIVYNPLAQMVEIIRAPVYGHTIPTYAFFFNFVMLVIGGSVTLFFFYRVRRHVAYWV